MIEKKLEKAGLELSKFTSIHETHYGRRIKW